MGKYTKQIIEYLEASGHSLNKHEKDYIELSIKLCKSELIDELSINLMKSS